MMHRSAAAILALLLAPALADAQTPPRNAKPGIAFEAEAVAASGFTPGNPVVWFGVERRLDPDFSTQVVRHIEVETAEEDGTARFALDGFDPLPGSPEAPARARGEDLWFVVDPRRMEITVLRGGIAQ